MHAHIEPKSGFPLRAYPPVDLEDARSSCTALAPGRHPRISKSMVHVEPCVRSLVEMPSRCRDWTLYCKFYQAHVCGGVQTGPLTELPLAQY